MSQKTKNSPSRRSRQDKTSKETSGNSFGQLDAEKRETNGYKLGKKPPTHVQLYYDVRDSSYWYQLNGRFVCMARSDLMMQLAGLGLSKEIYFDGQREIDWPLWDAQNNRAVDYAGPLAGHKVGIFTDGSGRKYLVTEEPAGIFTDATPKSEKSKWPDEPQFFAEFIRQILPEEQHLYFCHWLAIALRSLKARDYRPGQVCIVAGEHGSGKSLLQLIITEVLGGRTGNPFPYMSGDVIFNGDFVGAEHWMIEDPRGSTRHPDRMDFGARLKEGAVNRNFWIHPKGKQAIGQLPLLRRITISTNLELEYLSVCPPFDPSFAEKAFLFLCAGSSDAPLPIFKEFRDAKTGELSREKIWQTVVKEIPHVRAWLVENFKMTQLVGTLRDDRFGIKAWHHPHLLAQLSSLSYESRLLELIDEVYFGDEPPHLKVEKKSQDIQKELLEKVRFEAEKVLRYPGACGSHLGKLAKSQPKRVVKNPPQNGYTTWTIHPPTKSEDKNQMTLGVTAFAEDAGLVSK